MSSESLRQTPMTLGALEPQLKVVDQFLTNEEGKITQQMEGLRSELLPGEFEQVLAILDRLEKTLINLEALECLQRFRGKSPEFQKAALKRLYPNLDDITAFFFIAYTAILFEKDENFQRDGLKLIRETPFPHKPDAFKTDEEARGWYMDTLLGIALDVRLRYETVEGYDISNGSDLERIRIYFSSRVLFASALESYDFLRRKLFKIFDVVTQTHENIIACDKGSPLMTSLSDVWGFFKREQDSMEEMLAFLWRAELAPLRILKEEPRNFIPYVEIWNDQQVGDNLRLRLYRLSHQYHLYFLLTLYAQGWTVDDLSNTLNWSLEYRDLVKKSVGLPPEIRDSQLFLQNLINLYQEQLSPKSAGIFEFYGLKALRDLHHPRYQKIKAFFGRRLASLREGTYREYSQELENRIKMVNAEEWEVFLQNYEGRGNLFSEGVFALEKAQSRESTAEVIAQIKHVFEKNYGDRMIQIFSTLKGSPDKASENGTFLKEVGVFFHETLGLFNLLADAYIYLLNQGQEDLEIKQLLGATIALYHDARHLTFKTAAMMKLNKE